VHDRVEREGAGHGVDPRRAALGGASAGGHLACRAALALFEGHLGHDPVDAADDVVPARGDLSLLPLTPVTTAECDSLRAQAVRFVELARSAGADLDHDDVAGVLHGYLNTVGDSPLADEALDRHVGWMRSRLGDVGGAAGNL
jgi:acetyl esterase/lipase